MKKFYICPVCGYDKIVNPIYDSNGQGTYEICPCCGFEFGSDDFPDKEQAFKNWRTHWIEKNYLWFSNYTKKPENWEPQKQLDNITKIEPNNMVR